MRCSRISASAATWRSASAGARTGRHGWTSCSSSSGLSGYRRRYPHQLSGGQQQRVALARALAIEPDIVLLDEPFSSLDAALRASVRGDVLDVLRLAGTTSILVTHDQDEALSMADQVAVLRHGVIAQLDTPAELYGHPEDPELAKFLGESNVLEGEVRDGMVTTGLGRLAVREWSGPAGRRDGHRSWSGPSRSPWGRRPRGELEGTVASYEYFGHDAVVRVRPGTERSARSWSCGSRAVLPLEPGHRIGLSVHGPVVAWPATTATGNLSNNARVTTPVWSGCTRVTAGVAAPREVGWPTIP